MPYLIGMAGPTCSGKTMVCTLLAERTGAEYISQDSFFVDKELYPEYGGFANMDTPNAVKFDMLYDALKALKDGRPAEIPIYDKVESRVTGTRTAYPRNLLLVEGFLLFYDPRIAYIFDKKFYMDVQADVQRARRAVRGVHADVAYFEEVVIPMFDLHGATARDIADHVILSDRPLETLADEIERKIIEGRQVV
ncbi:MAG TPA: hypothetical protein VJB05_01025 [archaeon]|nr:hypothetical protein [archaeon]